jgi:hypothetical protein
VKAEEILLVDEGYKTPAGWLKEIAYQLAVMNESRQPASMPLLQPVSIPVAERKKR